MGEDNGKAAASDPGQAWDTIALFEQILESQPDDLSALDVLTSAYRSVGDFSKTCRYGLRLAEKALQTHDLDRMKAMRELLLPHASGHADMEACVRLLTERLSAEQAASSTVEAPVAETPGKEPFSSSALSKRLRMVVRPGSPRQENDVQTAPSPTASSVAAPVAETPGKEPFSSSALSKRLRMVVRPGSPRQENDVQTAPSPTASSTPPSSTAPQEAGDDAAMKEALGRVSAFLGGESAPTHSAASSSDEDTNRNLRSMAAARRQAHPLSDSGRRRTIVSEEMNLAWDLQQAGLLTEDHYAAVVRDLTELSSSETPVTISALHALQFRSFSNIDQVLQYMVGKCEMPIIPLASFDPQGTAFANLPLNYMIVQGVIPFESLGADLLVGILNPLNERVRCEVQELTGHTCHFFLVSPADFDTTLETVRNRYPAVAALRRQQEVEEA